MNKSIEELILERLQEYFGGDVAMWAFQDYDELQLGLGEIEEVDGGGGYEKGSDWFRVFYFKEHGVYLRTEGWYSSYSGTEFEDGFGKLVTPVEKTVTVFS